MTSPPTSRDDGRESRSANGGFLRARLDALSMLSHRVSGVICALAAFTFMWLVMLGLPLIYEARLAKLEQSAGEQLAFEQTTAQAAERVEEANTQQFAEPNPAESQTGQVLIKRCVFEWQACAMLNTVTLGLVGTLLSTTTDSNPYICRALLYLAIVVELWALVIGIIYLAHFRYFQNSGESGLWLSHAYKKGICAGSFLSFPALWSIWALLFLSVSLLSYVWTPSGDPSISSLPVQVTSNTQLAGYIWPRLLPTAVFPIALWNIWVIRKVISHRLSETS